MEEDMWTSRNLWIALALVALTCPAWAQESPDGGTNAEEITAEETNAEQDIDLPPRVVPL